MIRRLCRLDCHIRDGPFRRRLTTPFPIAPELRIADLAGGLASSHEQLKVECVLVERQST
ncbi:hypothetical protein [Rhizobium rhizophilum]|uniref:Uncharacterized protein n=1 Tax=Rhizobium rhizophilum TaxID=1850373 RepID=A0ABY2QV68_9HYPH|nr:hypothetical protein [Rhizobium rhizophilum]THV14971.1 hypothetical protein E9677_06290 [Rhizobium rhizophilum]